MRMATCIHNLQAWAKNIARIRVRLKCLNVDPISITKSHELGWWCFSGCQPCFYPLNLFLSPMDLSCTTQQKVWYNIYREVNKAKE